MSQNSRLLLKATKLSLLSLESQWPHRAGRNVKKTSRYPLYTRVSEPVCGWSLFAAMNCLRALRLSKSVKLMVRNKDALKKDFIIQPACCLSTKSTAASLLRPPTHLDPFHLKMWVVCVWWTYVGVNIYTLHQCFNLLVLLTHIRLFTGNKSINTTLWKKVIKC